jgi:hypothetical protein
VQFAPGLRDARENKPPYFWALAFNAEHRRELLRHGWKDIAKVFVAVVILGVIYQVVMLHKIDLGEASVVAILLAIIRCLLLCAPVARLAGRRKGRP